MSRTIGQGSRVRLHYTITLGDGSVAETTRDGDPATIVIGSGELPELLERQLMGGAEGESRSIALSASETRAMANHDTAQSLPRSGFPAGMDVEPGQLISFSLPNGDEIPGYVLATTDDNVTVDFDHPLAGRDVRFDIEILDIDRG